MAELGPIGRNVTVASKTVSYSQYGSAVSFTPPAPTFTSNDIPTYNARLWSPAGPTTTVSGVTKENDVVIGGITVFLYDHNSGTLLGKAISDASGNFSIPALGRLSTFVLATNAPNFNAIIFDEVVPV